MPPAVDLRETQNVTRRHIVNYIYIISASPSPRQVLSERCNHTVKLRNYAGQAPP